MMLVGGTGVEVPPAVELMHLEVEVEEWALLHQVEVVVELYLQFQVEVVGVELQRTPLMGEGEAVLPGQPS